MKTLFTLLFACTSLQASVVTLNSDHITTTVTDMGDHYLYRYDVVPRIDFIYSVKNPSKVIDYKYLGNVTLYVDNGAVYDQFANKSYNWIAEYTYRVKIDDIQDTRDMFTLTYKSPYAPVESYAIINYDTTRNVECVLTPGTVCIPEPSSAFLLILPSLLLLRRKRNG